MSVRNLVKSIQDIMRKDTGVDGDAQRMRILSRTRGESWQSLSSKLRDAGVAPFKPGDTDYGNIYLKYDVQSALPE